MELGVSASSRCMAHVQGVASCNHDIRRRDGAGERRWPRKAEPNAKQGKQEDMENGLALRSRRPATGVSRALRARVSQGVFPRVSPKTGVSDGVFNGVSPGPEAPECSRSVSRASPECQKGVPDTLGTLSGYFLDTPEPEPKGRDTPWDTPSDTPVFGDTPRDTRARRARETPVAGRRDRKSISRRLRSRMRRARKRWRSRLSSWRTWRWRRWRRRRRKKRK